MALVAPLPMLQHNSTNALTQALCTCCTEIKRHGLTLMLIVLTVRVALQYRVLTFLIPPLPTDTANAAPGAADAAPATATPSGRLAKGRSNKSALDAGTLTAGTLTAGIPATLAAVTGCVQTATLAAAACLAAFCWSFASALLVAIEVIPPGTKAETAGVAVTQAVCRILLLGVTQGSLPVTS